MKILLTGGTGYIGSHVAVELLEAGHEVVIADNLCNSERNVIDRIKKITGTAPEFYEYDLTDKELVRNLFRSNEFDAVMHFAGYKAVGESTEKPLMYYRNNLDSTLTLLEVMNEYNVKNIIFSSSATVYGEEAEVPYVETEKPTGCTNPYGWTKFMIEEFLKDEAFADSDLSVVALRYFNPIGAHKSGLIGEKPNGIPNNLMPYITQVAAGKLPYLNVYGDDYSTHDGTGVRDYIHVVDLAKGHVAALDFSTEHKGFEVINLGTGHGYSVLDVVDTFEKVNKIKIPYEIKGRRAGDLAVCYADAHKAEELLGWKTELGIEDMVRDSWRWQKHCEEE